MREAISKAMKAALKNKDQTALSAIRLISAALKDRDIAARTADSPDGINDEEILSMLQTMIKQRNESAKMYLQGNREDLANKEKDEINVIQQFLPAQLSEKEITNAIAKAIKSNKASSIKDMGSIMTDLKKNYAGQMDFGLVSKQVKESLMKL